MAIDKSQQSRDLHYNLRPDQIKIDEGFNQRIKFNMLDEIRESIRAIGLQTPIKVERIGDDYVIRDGETRYKAILQLIAEGVSFETIKCVLVKGLNPFEIALLPVLANVSRSFNELEKGRQFKVALQRDPGRTVADIARATGLTHPTVQSYIDLANSPIMLQQLLIEERLSATTAIEILKKSQDENWDNLKFIDYLTRLMAASFDNKKGRITSSTLRQVSGGSGRTLKKISKDLLKSHQIVDIDEEKDKITVMLSFKEWEDFQKSIK